MTAIQVVSFLESHLNGKDDVPSSQSFAMLSRIGSLSSNSQRLRNTLRGQHRKLMDRIIRLNELLKRGPVEGVVELALPPLVYLVDPAHSDGLQRREVIRKLLLADRCVVLAEKEGQDVGVLRCRQRLLRRHLLHHV